MNKKMDEWAEEWPTEPGYYWFYGWPFILRHYAPRLHFVHVRKLKKNGLLLMATNGHFLWQSRGAYGLFMSAEVQELPELDKEERT